MKRRDPNKPHKSKWIYGVGRRSSRKPHFPPIIPVITNELRDEMIAFLTRGVMLRQQEDLLKLKRLEAETGRIEGQGEDAPVIERRRLAMVRREAEALRSTLEQKLAGLEARIARDVANMALLRGVRQIGFTDRRMLDETVYRVLVFTTAPIKINTVLLGTYDFYYTPSIGLSNLAFDLQRRDRTHERGPHPHYRGGPCYGTFGPALHMAHTNCRFQLLFGLYMQYLAIYDAGSPLIPINQFKPNGRWSSHANQDLLA